VTLTIHEDTCDIHQDAAAQIELMSGRLDFTSVSHCNSVNRVALFQTVLGSGSCGTRRIGINERWRKNERSKTTVHRVV
jgi:hypothetical protein